MPKSPAAVCAAFALPLRPWGLVARGRDAPPGASARAASACAVPRSQTVGETGMVIEIFLTNIVDDSKERSGEGSVLLPEFIR